MSVKLSVTGEPKASPVAETDLIDSAIEIHAAYESLLESGVQIAELDTVVGNINFIKDTIQSNGVKWFKENCDPKDDFGRLYGLTGSDKETWMKGCDAAVESILGDIWNKIKEWWEKFINWIKDLFKRDTTKVVEETVTRAEKNAKEAEKSIAAEPEKKAKVPKTEMSKKGSNRLKAGWNRLIKSMKGLKERFIKSSSSEALDGNVRVVDGDDTMPTLEALKTMADIIIPEGIAAMDKAISGAKQLILTCYSTVSSAKTKEDCEKAADACDKGAETLYQQTIGGWEKKATELENNKNFECKATGEYVTLEQMHIHTEHDAVAAITYLKKITQGARQMEGILKKMNDFADSAKQEASKFLQTFEASHDVDKDEMLKVRNEIAREMNQFSTGIAYELGDMAASFDVMYRGLASITEDISNALTKAAA